MSLMLLEEVRRRFQFEPGTIHLTGMVMASHPDVVRRSIAGHRKRLDSGGAPLFLAEAKARRLEILGALDGYFGVPVGEGALTHSTTVALAQVLGGVRMTPGSVFLTSDAEHAATTETLRLRRERDGTPHATFSLYRSSFDATPSEIVANTEAAIVRTPHARVLVLAWVYSSDGVKLPVSALAELVAAENARRSLRGSPSLLFVVDGVHGFGIEDTTFPELGCDFFLAGTHKSVFGPRGTAVICGRRESWSHLVPFAATLAGADGPASAHIPGGVRAHEHWWSLAEAFRLHTRVLGKAAVQAHVHGLARGLKAALVGPGITMVTPVGVEVSSGIVCFDVKGRSPSEVLDALAEEKVFGSESAADVKSGQTHVRLSPSIYNTAEEIEFVAKLVKALVSVRLPATSSE